MAKLFVVGTPIGNLGDFSPRAEQTLRDVDFIAAEDTRVTMKLLTHFEIQRPMISYHEHNLRQRGEEILERINAGENCAIVTDAGMPCISDPGEDLVRLCAERGVEVVSVPSPTAAMTALAISGLPTKRFVFEGFLSVNKNQRATHLTELKPLTQTLIFYEAPHKLKQTLSDLMKFLGDRRISLCRELTKLHEEVIRGTVREMIERYELEEPRGEYVLIVEGAPEKEEAELSLDEAVEQAQALVDSGVKASEASKTIASRTSFSKSEIYAGLLGKN